MNFKNYYYNRKFLQAAIDVIDNPPQKHWIEDLFDKVDPDREKNLRLKKLAGEFLRNNALVGIEALNKRVAEEGLES